uniref:Amyloid beta A4 protein n=1 Tax=Hirondellea gigas TaxID=1518452 RepID=A0A6A7FYZ2_9CRUS
MGQCPFLVPAVSQACDLECTNDAHCDGDKKCCSNGCGLHCARPIIKTACQHQRALLEHRAREAGVPAGRVYLPACNEAGNFVAMQCHPATTTCWCVDHHGLEVPGTRLSQPAIPDCSAPVSCPRQSCDLACLHGYALDNSGCPVCSCRDPCEEVRCNHPMEECRIVHVACVGEPCPPLPVCLPKLDNPCPSGSPLNVNGSVLQCGPEGSVCPSSHKCHLSPLGEYALCCRKPREVCYEPRDSGFCEGSIRRWRFDPENNQCKRFRFGGCGGNLNNFESEQECENACPVLTSCEMMRARNLQRAKKNNKMTFIPKCHKKSGAWLPHQCLEELGVCWCVTPGGDQVEGSLTRGAPVCSIDASARSARRLDVVLNDLAKPINSICEAGETVHVCDKTACDNKVCLSNPSAVCRINPCSGCHAEFVDEYNTPLDCNSGLSTCQQELQTVLNSAAFTKSDALDPLSGAFEREQAAALYDLTRNADVYHSQAPAQYQQLSGEVYPTMYHHSDHVYPTQYLQNQHEPDSSVDRQGRVGKALDLTVTGDVVQDSTQQMHRKQRSVNQDAIIVSDEDLFRPSFGNHQQTVLAEDSPISLDYETQDFSVKPGTCPSPASDLSLLTCEPRQECLQDSHCHGSAKCCFTGCGSTCLQPQEVPASSEGLSASVPLCESDGSYARTQTSQGWAWCVDSKGRPLHHTLTRGHVRCGPNGQILEQVSQGEVCPSRPGVAPQVCRDECLTASCAAHPDAVCVADPCNHCQVSFYSGGGGEKVHCSERCSQPVATGMCRGAFRRFFHNASSGACEEFLYGGCQGNDNNFATLDECNHHCEKPKSPCEMPVRPGHCGGGEARWYYNVDSRACEPFLYTGCDGNNNNFPSKLQCQATCPELVLCPYWSSSSMEPSPCSRTEACRNQTCHNRPKAVCTVEPCSCLPYFTDQGGHTIHCLTPTQPPKTILAFSYDQDLPDDLSSEEMSGSKGPVTIYLEGEASLGRCELLRRHLSGLPARGPNRYLPQCDIHGNFLPTQCYAGLYVHEWSHSSPSVVRHGSNGGVTQRCWCVDETGKKTHPSAHFLKGQRECEHVMVESVVVTLGFHGHKLGLDALGRRHEKEIREQMSEVLASLRPATLDGKLAIVDLPDVTQVKFTLRGDGKIDAAYKLEDKVRKGELVLLVSEGGERRVPADMRASWFHHQVAPPAWRRPSSHSIAGTADAATAREVVSQMESVEPPFLAATVVITVLSAMLICGLVVAVVLYRRHVANNYPKLSHGSMQSLAFSDTSMDRRSISSGKFCSQLEHPRLDAKRPPYVTTIENEFRAVTRH